MECSSVCLVGAVDSASYSGREFEANSRHGVTHVGALNVGDPFPQRDTLKNFPVWFQTCFRNLDGHPILGRILKKTFSANYVKRLGEVYEGYIQRHVMLPALFLELLDG